MDPDTPSSTTDSFEHADGSGICSHFDIVIAGGGTVGCLLALALLKLPAANGLNNGLNIAVVEAQPLDFSHSVSATEAPGKTHPAFDNRAIALSRHSLDFLTTLGLGEQIEQVTAAIQDIHVSDQHFPGQSLLTANSLGVSESGRVIELQKFGRILQRALANTGEQTHCGHCQWFCPDTVEQVKVQQHAVELTLQSQQRLSASLLLVTEGGNSSTRSQLPVPTQLHDYHQSAVIVNVAMSQSHGNRAYERFTENGPLAFLPMTDNRCSVVWTIAREQEETLIGWSDDQFASALQTAFGYRLGKVLKVGKRHIYPLRLALSNSQHLHRAALLGNAAQMLHPIAGQGFNLGLRDVEDMVQTIQDGLLNADSNEFDPGSFNVLSAYRHKRKTDVQQTVLATHGLVHLFSNRELLPVAGRNLGLYCLENMPALKRWFGARAMGEIPRN